VNHFTTFRFWEHYYRLPQEIPDLADKNFQLLKTDPQHPSLLFKKIGSLWSLRVGIKYRALGTDRGEDVLWFWIGSDADYELLLQ
jgi:hypothetical protein